MRALSASASNRWFEDAFGGSRLMLILRGYSPAAALEICADAWDGGVRIAEIPVQTPRDLDTLAAVAAAGRARGLPVGVGTVIDAASLASVRDAGAVFTVSPGTDPDLIAASLRAGLPTLPGVATPSDVQRCVAMGLAWVKAFPAGVLGPGWIRAMRGPFPRVSFVATGGVDAANAAAFLEGGATAVAVGAALGDRDQREALIASVAAGASAISHHRTA